MHSKLQENSFQGALSGSSRVTVLATRGGVHASQGSTYKCGFIYCTPFPLPGRLELVTGELPEGQQIRPDRELFCFHNHSV